MRVIGISPVGIVVSRPGFAASRRQDDATKGDTMSSIVLAELIPGIALHRRSGRVDNSGHGERVEADAATGPGSAGERPEDAAAGPKRASCGQAQSTPFQGDQAATSSALRGSLPLTRSWLSPHVVVPIPTLNT